MIEYGIWSDEAGGFVERSLYTATGRVAALAAQRLDDPDARLLALCPDHADEEQPQDGCGLCAEETS